MWFLQLFIAFSLFVTVVSVCSFSFFVVLVLHAGMLSGPSCKEQKKKGTHFLKAS